jgi:hypothetical protein
MAWGMMVSQAFHIHSTVKYGQTRSRFEQKQGAGLPEILTVNNVDIH